MPDLVEQMYCSQQINIPPTFPFILKQYCKAAIRTQPYDLLRWSAAYFRCLAKGEPPPVKVRLEFPGTEFPSGLTAGYLKILLNQFTGRDFVDTDELYKKWRGICLPDAALAEILMLGGFDMEVEILKFIAISAGYLCDKLSRTMILVCELLTEEPEGGSAMIPCAVFIKLFTFLAYLNCGPVLPNEISQLPPDFFSKVPLTSSLSDSARETSSSSGSETPVKDKGLEGSIKDALWSALVSKLPECESQSSKQDIEEQDLEDTSYSDPQLRKCISAEEVKSVESMIKKALWSSVTEKLEIVEMDPDEVAILKEQVWQLVLRKIEHYKPDDGDLHAFLYSLILEIPALKVRLERAAPSEKSPSQILRDAIWAAITEQKPPPPLKGTVWGTLNKFEDLSPDDIKNVIWEAVLNKIPLGQYPYAPYEGEGDESIIKCEPQRVPSEIVPEWVGRPIPVYRVEVKGIGPVLPEDQVEAVIEFIKACCDYQEGMVMPRNIRHFLCPPLDPPGMEDLVDDILKDEAKEDDEKDSKSGSVDIDMETYEMNALKDIECYTKPY